MKVVLFCGGLGMRIREASENVPKPMVHVGDRPILWHVMKYYAHFGHKDFILCLGYQAEVIKNYFVNYNEFMSNDFVLSNGGKDLRVFNSDIHDWTITFVNTGVNSNIGQRLKAVEPYLQGEEAFLANYSDNVTDFHLPNLIERFREQDKTGAFLCVRPSLTCHYVCMGEGGLIQEIKTMGQSGILINGGYFVFKRSIFDYLKDGEELVQEPFHRLIQEKRLMGYGYDGFWKSMDTFKEKQELDDLHSKNIAPWEVWKRQNAASTAPRENAPEKACVQTYPLESELRLSANSVPTPSPVKILA
jgi:glucose-1-phosphate cytidylyltransferase